MKIATKVNMKIATKILEALGLKEFGLVQSFAIEVERVEHTVTIRVRPSIVLNEAKSKALAQALGISDDDEDDGR